LNIQNLGSQQKGAFDLIARPNPTHDKTWLSLTDEKSYNGVADIFINLYNIRGQLVHKAQWEGTKVAEVFPLELPTLPFAGLYVAQVRINQMSSEIYIIKN